MVKYKGFKPITNIGVECYGVLIALFLVVLNTTGVIGLKGWPGAGIFNVLYPFHSMMLIVTGCKVLNVKSTYVGCLLLGFISMARYADLLVSLLARSAVFLIMGAALFATGFSYF